MKTKLLLLVVLCIQCALTMVAAEERKPAKPNKITAWWRQRVMALPSHCLFLDCPFTISDGDEYEKHLHDAHNFDVQEAVVYLHAIKDPIVKRRKKIRNYQWSSEVLTKYVSQCFLFPLLGEWPERVFQRVATTFTMVRHARCGANSVFHELPPICVEQICGYLRGSRELKQWRCKFCPFLTYDNLELEAHIERHFVANAVICVEPC